MRSFILFSGTGPILILTTHGSVCDPELVAKLAHKGIAKFIAYELDLELVRRAYGVAYEVVASDLAHGADVRVLDFNGHHLFSRFSFADLGEPITYDGEA